MGSPAPEALSFRMRTENGATQTDLILRSAAKPRVSNLGDEAVLVALLDERGHDGTKMLESAKSDATGAIYAKNAEDAVAANVIGSPCYVLDGEVFWGQDRLGLLESALKSGRQAYRMDAAE